MKRETIQRVATPTAMLIGLDGDMANVCHATLADNGIRVLRVQHVAPALERIPVVMPQLVVVPTTFAPSEDEALNDRCVAVGAQVVKLEPDEDRRTIEK